MKTTKMNEELRSMSLQELTELEMVLRKNLLTLRLNSAASHVKDYSQFSKLRHSIARVMTHLQKRKEKDLSL